jgi:hypothetical protein
MRVRKNLNLLELEHELFLNTSLEQKNKRMRDPIEDTPVQKQNATRMATRQQKIIKRISFHNIKTPSVVPDTPVKSNCEYF